MANEDPELERIENRLARIGTALQIATALELQRQQIAHRLEEKLVPQTIADRLEDIIEGMAENLKELCGWLTPEFTDTVAEKDRKAGEKRRQSRRREE